MKMTADARVCSGFYIQETCVMCGACASDCPVQCIRRGSDRFVIGVACIACGDCVTICPVGAIVISRDATINSI